MLIDLPFPHQPYNDFKKTPEEEFNFTEKILLQNKIIK